MFARNFLKKIAEQERVGVRFLETQLKKGEVVIPLNRRRRVFKPVAIGAGCRVKVNTNIGTSTEKVSVAAQKKKIEVAVASGTDTIMDLSVGGDIVNIRKQILSISPVALGTVPIYEAAFDAERKRKGFENITFNGIVDVLKRQAEDGVDFFTIHAGILRSFLSILKRRKRVGGIVSRGGAILARWMYVNKKENPFFENFDTILKIAKEYNITLSLGDALRPGAIADSTDDLQVLELKVLGKLVKKCRDAGVQVIVEGPGHLRLDEIASNMALQKNLCDNAPFYVLGPLPTDIAAGYDHITASIGGAIAAFYGANFLCVVTPAEHLRLPSLEDIRDGVIASRIAAHCVDVLRFKHEWNRDYRLSLYRSRRDWEKIFPLTIDEKKAREYRKQTKHNSLGDMCTMCGKFCSLKIVEKCNLLK